jgi:hypothetical protein
MAVRGRREADGRRGASRVWAREQFARTENRPWAEPVMLQGSKKAGALDNNNESASAAADGDAAGTRTERIGVLGIVREKRREEADAAQHAEAMKRKYQERDQANIKQEQDPMEPQRGCCASGNDGEVDACRSLLIPRAHFGAAGGAAVFALGAGRFLPLAGPTGSSCA